MARAGMHNVPQKGGIQVGGKVNTDGMGRGVTVSPPRALKNKVKQAHELADDLFGGDTGKAKKLTVEPHKMEV